MPERILKVLTEKFQFARIWGCHACRMCMALAAALMALSVCYAGFAHAGVVYSWTKTIGGVNFDESQSVAVDSSGNVYLTGYFSGTVDFDPDPVTTDNHTSVSLDEDVFLTKINSDGTYGWTKTMGGTDDDRGYSVTVDSNSNVHVTGRFQGTADFDPDPVTTDSHTSAGDYDIFLTKFNPDGTYAWTKTMGESTSEDRGVSVATDSSGNVYLAGFFYLTVDFDPDPVATDNHTSAGTLDIFLTKINSDGTYGWTKTMGGTSSEEPHCVTVDSSGNIYLAADFSGTVDFDPGAGTDNHTSAGGGDISLTKINSDGTYGWTKTMGGTGEDMGWLITVDSGGNVYIGGLFSGTADFDPGAGTDNHTSAGGWDIFITRINSDSTYGWTKTMGGTGDDLGGPFTVDISGNVYIIGLFSGTVDFDPDAGTDSHTSAGGFDIFLMRINSDGTYGWTKTMGGSEVDAVWSSTADSSGNIYLTGLLNGIADFDPDPVATDNHSSAGSGDIFLTKFIMDSTPNILVSPISGNTTEAGGQATFTVRLNSEPSANVTIPVTSSDPNEGTVDKSSLTFTTLNWNTDQTVTVTGVDDSVADGDQGYTIVLGAATSADAGYNNLDPPDVTVTNRDNETPGSAGVVYSWTKTMGGTTSDESQSVAVDSSGNVYLTGGFSGTADFDPDSIATDNHASAGFEDIFLTRINSDGTYGWTKTMGGADDDRGYSVAVDGSGNVYVTGRFQGTADFDPDPVTTDSHTSAGDYDVFLTKLNPDGTYAWTKTMGESTNEDRGVSVATDSSGNVYLAGFFYLTVDFNPDPIATDNHTSAGTLDIFLTKINSDGSYGWTKTMGGTTNEDPHCVTVDSSGNIYLAADFTGTADFDPGAGTDNHTSAGVSDISLTKINSNGTYAWTKTMGGSGDDLGAYVTTDSSGNVYIGGLFSGTADFDPGAGTDSHTSAGGADIFLTKINSNGTYAWTKTMGGSGEDAGFPFAVDSNGNVYATGWFQGTVDFDPGAGTDNHISAGGVDIFLTRINPDGTYAWTKTMGGTGDDQPWSGTADSSGNIYLTGLFNGTADFDPNEGITDNHTSAGASDIFLTKFIMASTPEDPGDSDAGGCFIDTAAFGSNFDPQVKVLRILRD